MEKFIVYGPGRTGTTALIELIGNHPESGKVECEIWRHRTDNPWHNLANNFDNFKKYLALSFEKYNGYKILVGHLDEQREDHVFTSNSCKVIITSRRNLLKSAVSRMIALQTSRWNHYQPRPEIEYKPMSLKCVSLYFQKPEKVPGPERS